jgi:hypothetical protein
VREAYPQEKPPVGRICSLPRREMSVPHLDLAVLFCLEEHLLAVRETTPCWMIAANHLYNELAARNQLTAF